jgi:hypothetical protein
MRRRRNLTSLPRSATLAVRSRGGKVALRALAVALLATCGTLASEPDVQRLYEGFRNPPAEYSLSPYWFWNGRVNAAVTNRQIGEMVKQNVRSAVVMNWAGLEPAYLSEAWWKEVGNALESARRAGLTLNFADEYLWPSGQAWDWASGKREPSRVLQLHPEYRMHRLTCRQVDVAAGLPKLDTVPEVVAAARLDESGRIDESSLQQLPATLPLQWTPRPGRWRLYIYTLVPAFERNVRVDLLNPAAVRTFIDLVYEQFAQRFPEHLGTTIRFFVSDHEGAYGAALPYTPALWNEFHKRRGYDLAPLLPLVSVDSPRAAQVRADYLETISELYATSFVGQITDWCTRHGVQHGHSDIEESLLLQTTWTGNMFALWRASTAPYVDALLDRARMPVDFEEALSVAHFEGRPMMVENQGLTGHESYWSLEKARGGTNMALVWGVNRLIPHYFEYDPTHVQYPPSWFLTQPLWRYFHHYADVAQRALYLNAQGRHNAPVAIYYPRESALAASAGVFQEGDRSLLNWHNAMDETQDYYSALQLELARRGFEYHIVDEHYMARAEIHDGVLQVGPEKFNALILPPMSHLAASSVAQIRRLAASGGTVLALGRQVPALDGTGVERFTVRPHDPFMNQLDYTVQIEVPEPVKADLEPLVARLRKLAPPAVEVVSGSREHLFFSHRFSGDADWYWAVNDSAEARSVKVKFPATGVLEKWDAETGSRSALSVQGGEVKLTFGPWDAFFVVRHGAGMTAAKPELDGERRLAVELPAAGWQLTLEAPVRVRYAKAGDSGELVWLAPERLANRSWWIAGPYPYGDHSGFFDVFPPEHGFDAQDKAWKWIESPTVAVRPASGDGVYYAYVNVWSPKARKARAAIAFADSVKLWWNEKLVLSLHTHPPFVNLRDPWSQRPQIDVAAGWNRVLLKIGPNPGGATGFLFRITDDAGNTLRDVLYAREPAMPRQKKTRRVRLSVEAPPGTRERTTVFDVDESEIPERPVEFAPETKPFALRSWTDTPLAYYSGSALYDTSFALPEARNGERVLLDLGEVGLSAEVWINGAKAGERAWRPFVFDITPYVHPGVNKLRVRVANSNAGAASQGDPVYEHEGWGVKFTSERDRLRTLRPNGLEGPVRIFTEQVAK